jgi:prevent-host-death family protein
MVNVSISEAREHLADLGNKVAMRGERIVVDRRQKHVFALVSMEDLELLEKIEDEMDLETIRSRRNEPDVAWEDLKKELGL